MGQGCAEIARLSKDVLECPNICFVLNNIMKKMLPSGTSRQDLSDVPDDDSWWSLCVNRCDAASRDIHVTSTPIYLFLVADCWSWQRHAEYTQSRQVFFTQDPSKPLALFDASKTPV